MKTLSVAIGAILLGMPANGQEIASKTPEIQVKTLDCAVAQEPRAKEVDLREIQAFNEARFAKLGITEGEQPQGSISKKFSPGRFAGKTLLFLGRASAVSCSAASNMYAAKAAAYNGAYGYGGYTNLQCRQLGNTGYINGYSNGQYHSLQVNKLGNTTYIRGY